MNYWYMASPIGFLTLIEQDGVLVGLDFGKQSVKGTEKETVFLKQVVQELEEYFAHTRTNFDIPVSDSGTPFQKQVWAALRTIPYGETRTYGEIAKQIGNPNACRAVGGANHHNPIAIITPCHRVVGVGNLGGFGGGIPIKQFLLELEHSNG